MLVLFLSSTLNSLIAACLIPVALGALGPTVLREIGTDWTRWFVFFGLCLAAAMSGERFSGSISRKIVAEIEGIQRSQKSLEEALSEPEDVSEGLKMGSNDDANEARILYALGLSSYPLRSLDGLARDVGISRDDLHPALQKLVAEGKIGSTKLQNGSVRWHFNP